MKSESKNPDFTRQVISNFGVLNQESDRGSAIVGAALIEDSLKEMIIAFLIEPEQKKDELFSGAFAPLGSLSSKIAISYRLGLISSNVRKSLDFIRKIRNDFAHTSHEIDFKTQSIHDRIREIFNLNKNLLDTIWDISKDSIVGIKSETDPIHGLDNLVENIGWKSTYNLVISIIAASLFESKKTNPKLKSNHRD